MTDGSHASPVEDVQSLRLLVGEVATGLQNQREILRLRGIGLPPASLQTLKSINDDLAKLYERLVDDQTELEQLRALTETSALINSSFNVDEVLNAAMDEVINLTGAERGYLIMRDMDSGDLDFRVMRYVESESAGSAINNPSDMDAQISRSIVADVLDKGEPMLADNAYNDPRMVDKKSVAALMLRSVLCVPLLYKDVITGVVYADNRLKAGVFGKRELNLLTAFANQAAVAIENARLYARIQASLVEITAIKELMDNVFASIGSGVITTNAADMVMMFNRAASEILTRQPESAIGQPLNAMFPKINIDFDQYLRGVREENQSQVLEAELDTIERGRIALNLKLSPFIDTNQETQGVAMVLDDVTEQNEREETLNVIRRYLPPALVDNIHSITQLGLGGERREVSCMFVNVRPIYSLSTDVRAQQMMETINTYLSVATDVIHKADGVIDKYMGNEIMVLFNTQLNPQVDHALRAVDAALALREAFVELYARLGISPDPHYYCMGIHTGIATLGNVGSLSRRDFTAIGDSINLSKRLEENARPGQILVSEDTFRHLSTDVGVPPQHIRCIELEALQVKGRQQLTRIYEVSCS